MELKDDDPKSLMDKADDLILKLTVDFLASTDAASDKPVAERMASVPKLLRSLLDLNMTLFEMACEAQSSGKHDNDLHDLMGTIAMASGMFEKAHRQSLLAFFGWVKKGCKENGDEQVEPNESKPQHWH